MFYTFFLLLSFWSTLAVVIGLGVAPLMRERVVCDGDADAMHRGTAAQEDWFASATGARTMLRRLATI